MRVSDLPPPPRGTAGWPWTEGSDRFAADPPRGDAWPRLSIVTPSYNQAEFLEGAIRSVLLQAYPNLEYVIIDGGSSDGSVEILEKYSRHLSYWRSRPDDGQYAAINEGFGACGGEVMAWLNSDDMYLPNAFGSVAEIFVSLGVEWITTLRPVLWSRDGRRLWSRGLPGFCKEAFLAGEYAAGLAPFHSAWIPQESTFWRAELWRRAGARVDESLGLAGDLELWARFFGLAPLHGAAVRLGGFRRHARQKTARDPSGYAAEARAVLTRHGGQPHGAVRAFTRKVVTRLPAPIRRALGPLGLARNGEIVVRDASRGWRAEPAAV